MVRCWIEVPDFRMHRPYDYFSDWDLPGYDGRTIVGQAGGSALKWGVGGEGEGGDRLVFALES